LAEKGHWGQDLTCITGLVELVTTYLDTILENGMRNAVQPLC
ncbi:altronate oxidoreductase, partial [Salmonella enterica]|nr:altronate oxidoreductase [Salmonella enterica]